MQPEQLKSDLERRGLAPLYLVAGDEPLQVAESLDLLRAAARRAGIDERTVLTEGSGYPWDEFPLDLDSPSLFSPRRYLEVRLKEGAPGSEAGAALETCVVQPRPHVTLVVIVPKLDSKTKSRAWYKRLLADAVVVEAYSVPVARLPDWIIRRAQRHALRIDRRVASFIAERVENNLLAAHQELEKLVLLGLSGTVSLADVVAAVSDSGHYQAFDLADAILQGDAPPLERVLRGLRAAGEEPVLIAWVVTRELRKLNRVAFGLAAGEGLARLYERFPMWEKHKPLVQKAIARLGLAELRRLLLAAERLERVSKGVEPGDPWLELESLCLGLAARA